MRIILEGPDNAGKTSLAKRLIEACGPEKVGYFHPGGKPDGVEAELKCLEHQTHLLRQSNILIDRITAISQQVYNPDGGMNELRREALNNIMSMQPVMIYCRPSTDKLLRVQDLTWREDEDEAHKQKIIRNQHTFVERYDLIFSTTPCISYNYEDEAHREIIFKKLVNGINGSVDDIMWFRQIMYLRGF